VVDGRVRAGKEQRLVAAPAPTNAVRRSTVVTDLEHFTVAVWLTDAVTLDHDAITWASAHSGLLVLLSVSR
jgi:hypothetical protein